MSKVGIATLRECMVTQANHWAIFPALILFAGPQNVTGIVILAWVMLGFLPTLMFLARDVIQSFILQIALFPVMLGTLILLPIHPDILKAAMILIGVIYVVLSVFKTFKNDVTATKVFPPFVPLCINLVLSVIAYYTIRTPITFTMHLSAIISITLSLLAYYVDRFFIFTVSNEKTSSNMPRSKMFQSGMLSAIKYLGVTSVIMIFIASFSVSDSFFGVIMKWINKGINWIATLLRKLFRVKERNTFLKDGADSEPLMRLSNEGPVTSPFWRLLEMVVFGVLIAVLFVGIFLFALKIIKLFMRVQGKKIFTEAEETNELLDLHESIATKLPDFDPEEEDDSFLSPSQRIRRLYRRKALSTQREPELLYRMTAREFATEEKLPEIAGLYEKARYSLETCTKEDVKQMQLACRRKNSES